MNPGSKNLTTKLHVLVTLTTKEMERENILWDYHSMYVCMYVCMYVPMSMCLYVSVCMYVCGAGMLYSCPINDTIAPGE